MVMVDGAVVGTLIAVRGMLEVNALNDYVRSLGSGHDRRYDERKRDRATLERGTVPDIARNGSP
jgi:hypothetical protein